MDKKEYATWNFPLWVDNDYGLYNRKIDFLKLLGRPVRPADAKLFFLSAFERVSANDAKTPDGAFLHHVDLEEIAADWELERLEWIA